MKINFFIILVLVLNFYSQSFAQKIEKPSNKGFLEISFLEIEIGRFFPTGYYQDIMNPGWSIFINSQFNPRVIPNFYLGLEAGALFSDFKKDESQKYSIFPIALLADYQIPLSDDFSASLRVSPGYYFLKGPDSKWYRNLYLKTGLGISYNLSSYLKTSLNADFVYFNDAQQSISGVNTSLSLSYVFDSVVSEKEVALGSTSMFKIFSALSTVYLKKPFGEIKVKNISKNMIKDLKISFFIKNYMTTPYISKQEYQIEPGKTISIPLYLSLISSKDKYMYDQITNGKLEIEYVNHKKEKRRKIESLKVHILNKNALTWENLNHFGAFITPTHKTINSFARQTAQIKNPSEPISSNLLLAAKIITALKHENIKYIQAAQGAYKSFAVDENQIDSIQAPVETLKSKTGNCADSTALIASLLESAGIPTAFVVTPNHIFLLLDASGIKSSKLISFQGKNWIPIETTLIHAGFKTAWEKGLELFQVETEKQIKTSFEAYSEFPASMFENSDDFAVKINIVEVQKDFENEMKKLNGWME